MATMADEAGTDWWTARRQAAAGATPPLQGPDAAPWRRSWSLSEAPDRRDRDADVGLATPLRLRPRVGRLVHRLSAASAAIPAGGAGPAVGPVQPLHRREALGPQRQLRRVVQGSEVDRSAEPVDDASAQPSRTSATAGLRASSGPWR